MSHASRLAYVRNSYGVPAKMGSRISYQGRTGTISGAINGRLRVRFDDHPGQVAYLHPTWEVTYL